MATCGHDAPYVTRACTHLFVETHDGYHEGFTGRGVESELLCAVCAATNERSHVVDACAECVALARDNGWFGIVGAPQILVAATPLAIVTDEIELAGCPPLVELAPLRGADRNRWLGVTSDGAVHELDLDTCSVRLVARVPADAIDLAQPFALHVSADARFAAVVNRKGARGAVLELASGRVTLPLVRDNYHADVCVFPFAFIERDGRTLAIHAPTWNRLDIYDALTGELVTKRESPRHERGEKSPPHYLDYFHCGLAVSPNQQRIADAGWVWAPSGIVTTWSLERWLDENVWESEDGPSRRALGYRDYEWDAPMCWLDDTRLVVWGYGQDDEWMIPGAVIFETLDGTIERWFPGPPEGRFVIDRGQLIVLAPTGISIWDLARGARVLDAPLANARYHPSARCFVTLPVAGRLTRARARGHHATAPWNTSRVRELAAAIADDLAGLPILGDALEAAGCDDAELLAHCHEPGPHGGRCWVLDQLHARD